ncbi:MAG: site-specific DNA-methyltransferase [Roseomonas sp.]|nr:site-specific DNA-methyltransferase [Roseomonas sp.]
MTELNFKGKEFVYNHHLAVPFRPLIPHAEKGIGPVSLDGNLIIHGDNLHALKALLPIYAGKVDCIFIDPPYNTGNEGWCYNDNVNAPMIKEWLASNPIGIEDGLRHDKWCAMMWPRLRLLHELLAEDGIFWITLDDNEAARGKLLLDEIFGDKNFIGSAIWQKKYSTKSDTNFLSPEHDFIFIYAKNKEIAEFDGLDRTEEQDSLYKNPDNDPRGVWTSDNLLRTEARDYAIFEIIGPNGETYFPPKGSSWRFNREKIDDLRRDNRIWFGVDGKSRPRLKRFLEDVRNTVPAQTIWKYAEVGHSDSAKKALQLIFQDVDVAFATPKPIQLVQRILRLIGKPNALVLDSFSGSGTTGHAVLESNKRDGGSRRFILIEMEDYADQLTAERLRRVIIGFDFKGTLRSELMREKINWTQLQKAQKLLNAVASIENLHAHEYDRIKKEVKDGDLIVTGEKTVTERAEGLGGSFTYCTLGAPLELDNLLRGETLPPYAGMYTYDIPLTVTAFEAGLRRL